MNKDQFEYPADVLREIARLHRLYDAMPKDNVRHMTITDAAVLRRIAEGNENEPISKWPSKSGATCYLEDFGYIRPDHDQTPVVFCITDEGRVALERYNAKPGKLLSENNQHDDRGKPNTEYDLEFFRDVVAAMMGIDLSSYDDYELTEFCFELNNTILNVLKARRIENELAKGGE